MVDNPDSNSSGSPDDLIAKCQRLLDEYWQELLSSETTTDQHMPEDTANLRPLIAKSINSNTKSYRYVLPTQILAKLADETLDCRCVQANRKNASGNFDARSICKKVIVPFDKNHENVLGGSSEPYVNNPLRIPEVSRKYRDNQKDKEGWDTLCIVLELIENKRDIEFTKSVFKITLTEIYQKLSQMKVTYPVPKRVSLNQILSLITRFQEIRSGGDHLLALSAALWKP